MSSDMIDLIPLLDTVNALRGAAQLRSRSYELLDLEPDDCCRCGLRCGPSRGGTGEAGSIVGGRVYGEQAEPGVALDTGPSSWAGRTGV